MYLAVAREQKQVLDEVETHCEKLLKRDPNSFDGHRLKGDLFLARSAMAYKTRAEGRGDQAAAQRRG